MIIIDTRNPIVFNNNDFNAVYKRHYANSQEIYKDLFGEFLEVASLTDCFVNLSLTAFGNPKYSNCYKEFCIFLTINELLLNPSNSIKVITDSYPLYKILQNSNTLKTVLVKKSFFSRFCIFCEENLTKINLLVKVLLQKLVISIYFRRVDVGNFDYVFETFVAEKYSHERFYPNIKSFLEQEDWDKTLFLPILIDIRLWNLPTVIKKLKLSNNSWLFREHYLTVANIFKAIFYKPRVKKLPKVIDYTGVNFWNFFEESLNLERFSTFRIEGILNVLFLERLKCFGEQLPRVFIDWWENSPIDKGMFFGIKKYFATTIHKAYLGYYPDLNSIQLSKYKSQFSDFYPEHLLIPGSFLFEFFRSNYPEANIKASPSFRRLEFMQTNSTLKNNNDNDVLVILPIYEESSLLIIDCIELLKSKKLIKGAIYKLHPSSYKKNILRKILSYRDNKIIDDKDLSDSILSIKNIICGQSSLVIQLILLGRRPLLINDDPFYPLRMIEDIEDTICKCIELYDFKRSLKDINQFFRSNQDKINTEISLERYYQEPSINNVKTIILSNELNDEPV